MARKRAKNPYIKRRGSAKRCAFCHDSIGEREGARCSGCDSRLHNECLGETRGCPTCRLPWAEAEAGPMLGSADMPDWRHADNFWSAYAAHAGEPCPHCLSPRPTRDPGFGRRSFCQSCRMLWPLEQGDRRRGNPGAPKFQLAFDPRVVLALAEWALQFIEPERHGAATRDMARDALRMAAAYYFEPGSVTEQQRRLAWNDAQVVMTYSANADPARRQGLNESLVTTAAARGIEAAVALLTGHDYWGDAPPGARWPDMTRWTDADFDRLRDSETRQLLAGERLAEYAIRQIANAARWAGEEASLRFEYSQQIMWLSQQLDED